MHRSSLVHRLSGVLFGLALLAGTQPDAARAADKKASKVTFDTVDGVTLQGNFYPSTKGKDEPTVLLLHKIGSDSHKDGWDSLADALIDKGYSVLSFDFRGHGNSTTVDAKFWDNRFYPWNARMIRGGALDAKGKPRDSINQKDFPSGYYPYFVNDIAAAKMFLDDRNDAGDCNSRSLIVIGAEDGAALGAVWMASEWNRFSAANVILDIRGPKFAPLAVRGLSPSAEGKDLFCSVWLSMTPSLGRMGVSKAVREALLLAGKDNKVPMGFLYGEKDETGKGHADEFIRLLKGTEPKESKLTFTAAQPIKGTKLTGSALLRKELDTQDKILSYLATVRDKNVPHKWTKIDLDRTWYVWTFNPRIPVIAKDEKSKVLEPIPLLPLSLVNP